jgi:hypothetical protein
MCSRATLPASSAKTVNRCQWSVASHHTGDSVLLFDACVTEAATFGDDLLAGSTSNADTLRVGPRGDYLQHVSARTHET